MWPETSVVCFVAAVVVVCLFVCLFVCLIVCLFVCLFVCKIDKLICIAHIKLTREFGCDVA